MFSVVQNQTYGLRYLLWCIVGFLLGVFYGISHPIAERHFFFFLCYSLSFLGISLLGFCLCFRFHLLTANGFLSWFLLLAFVAGIGRVMIFDSLQCRTLKKSAGESCLYTGILLQEGRFSKSEKSLGFPVEIYGLQRDEGTEPCSGRIFLFLPKEVSQDLEAGDGISFRATLTPPKDASYPGGFSMRHYLYSNQYLFQCYTKHVSKVEAEKISLPAQLSISGSRIRTGLLSFLDRSFEPDSAEEALLKGILLGDREGFSAEQYQDFTDSGLVHIISISGMHVMFFANILLYLMRRLRFPMALTLLMMTLLLTLFAAVSAFAPSACRSVLTVLLWVAAQSFQREPDGLQALAVAAFLLVLQNPYLITSYSFLFSFSATLGILLFSAPLGHLFARPFRSIPEKPKGLCHLCKQVLPFSVGMSMASLLGLGFFMSQFYRKIAWGGILANLLLLPLTTATFFLGYLLCALAPWAPAAASLLADGPLRLLLFGTNTLAKIFSLPFFRLTVPTPPPYAILPYLILAGAFYLFLKTAPQKKKKSRR